jgi:hypothetical protein
MSRKPHRSKAKSIAGPEVVEDSTPKIAGVLVHPDAAWFPMMSDADLDRMAADIKQNGLKDPPEYIRGKDGVLRLGDGRNRVRAAELIAKAEGRELERHANGLPKVGDAIIIIEEKDMPDVLGYVLSRNLHRRQLKDDQRDDVIRRVRARYPDFSIRRLADVTGASKSAVHRAVQEEPVKPPIEEIENSLAGNLDAEEPADNASGVPGGTPDQQPKPEPAPQLKPEPKRVIGKDGKRYSKKRPAKSKPTGEKPFHNAKLIRDDAVVIIGSELAKKSRETIECFIKLMEDARIPVLKIGDETRVALAVKFAAALGFGPEDLISSLQLTHALSHALLEKTA